MSSWMNTSGAVRSDLAGTENNTRKWAVTKKAVQKHKKV